MLPRLPAILSLSLGLLCAAPSLADGPPDRSFSVGEEVLIEPRRGSFGADPSLFIGTVARVMQGGANGARKYQVRYDDGTGMKQLDLPHRELAGLNTWTTPQPGLLNGLPRIIHDPTESGFKSLVGKIDNMVGRAKIDLSRPQREIEAQQVALVKDLVELQKQHLSSDRNLNQRLRKLSAGDYQYRTFGDILKQGKGGTHDANALLWATASSSASFKKAGFRAVQLLRTKTPANYDELSVLFTLGSGRRCVVDPVWQPSVMSPKKAIYPFVKAAFSSFGAYRRITDHIDGKSSAPPSRTAILDSQRKGQTPSVSGYRYR